MRRKKHPSRVIARYRRPIGRDLKFTHAECKVYHVKATQTPIYSSNCMYFARAEHICVLGAHLRAKVLLPAHTKPASSILKMISRLKASRSAVREASAGLQWPSSAIMITSKSFLCSRPPGISGDLMITICDLDCFALVIAVGTLVQ